MCAKSKKMGELSCFLESRILSSSWVVDIKKWFKIWDVEDPLELSSDAMKYVIIEESDATRKRWKDAERIKFEYYIVQINLNIGFYIRQEGLLIVFNLTALLT